MTQLKTREAHAPAAARPMGAGGRRLAAAFDSVSSLPALADARNRLLALADAPSISASALVDVIEADPGIAVAVVRAANNGIAAGNRAGGVASALDALGAARIVAIAGRLDAYDLLAPAGTGFERYDSFRRHAREVSAAADRVAHAARIQGRDELVFAALVHDVGRLVLGDLYGAEFGLDAGVAELPEDRIRRERRELGVDHALVGSVLIRRWGLPDAIATAVERHHSVDATGLAAGVRLADLIVHRLSGGRISPDVMRAAALAVDLDEAALRTILFELPGSRSQRRRTSEPCPLSDREIDALRGLAGGKVYKQIASELSLSVSTVRTHLHNVYGKIGVVDRAQAVLVARDRGWI